ncbi:MAG: hypothetical protein V7603_5689 [Micromonosporaceae bacterium]
MEARPSATVGEFSRGEIAKELQHDYSSSDTGIVPPDRRRSRYHFLALWVTFTAGFTYLFLGDELLEHARRILGTMCRNITELRGLEPPATSQEVEAAAAQFVRKVTGIGRPNPAVAAAMQEAVQEISEITGRLLAGLPARRQEPTTLPPLRRPEVRKRLGLGPLNP